MSKPRRLGRGLANLIPDHPVAKPASAAGRVRDIPIDLIERNPEQPRRRFDRQELDLLADSIRADGVLTPILLRPIKGGRFRLVAGERRWRAAGLAGLAEIPALLREAGDEDLLVWALAENLLRSDLSPVETANALAELEARGLNHTEIGKRLGLARPSVSNYLRLRKLAPALQQALDEGRLTAGHARALLMLEDPDQRLVLAQEIEKKGLSVRAAEARARVLAKGKSDEQAGAPVDSPQLRSVRTRLERALGSKVQLKVDSNGRGSMTLRFKNNEELSRILDHIEREF